MEAKEMREGIQGSSFELNHICIAMSKNLLDESLSIIWANDYFYQLLGLKREDVKSIPIIALTANVFFDDIIQAQRAGMNDHIAKPIDIDNLTSILEKYI